jgi:hypothetical protein
MDRLRDFLIAHDGERLREIAALMAALLVLNLSREGEVPGTFLCIYISRV